jgi:D-alanyl-D-alanine carboxypeptidase/D-alanyl-D-alanine-endopeptidase (penicillin-binding protein 4)
MKAVGLFTPCRSSAAGAGAPGRRAEMRTRVKGRGADGSLTDVCDGQQTCPGRGKVWAKPGTDVGQDAVNNRLAVGGQALGGYLDAGHGKLWTVYLTVNGASAPDIEGALDIIDAQARILGILQQQAARSH